MDAPKLESGGLASALIKASTTHAEIRQHIEAHAEAVELQRVEAHDKLHARNVMEHKS